MHPWLWTDYDRLQSVRCVKCVSFSSDITKLKVCIFFLHFGHICAVTSTSHTLQCSKVCVPHFGYMTVLYGVGQKTMSSSCFMYGWGMNIHLPFIYQRFWHHFDRLGLLTAQALHLRLWTSDHWIATWLCGASDVTPSLRYPAMLEWYLSESINSADANWHLRYIWALSHLRLELSHCGFRVSPLPRNCFEGSPEATTCAMSPCIWVAENQRRRAPLGCSDDDGKHTEIPK